MGIILPAPACTPPPRQQTMFYYVRFLFNAVRALCTGQAQTFYRVASRSLRVWPDDIDWNRHANHAAYATFFEYARIDWLLRHRRYFKRMRFVVAEESVTFHKELKWGSKFEVTTRCTGVDGRHFYGEHEIWQDRVLCSRGRFHMMHVGRHLKTADILHLDRIHDAP